MALTITHAQVAGTGADADAIVDGADWDANHSIAGSVAASEVTGGAALTKTDDTNVTLTLGGTPATALLAATSVTVGWTGTLAASRGGTGISSLGTGVATALGVNVGSAGAFVTFNGALGTPSSGTLTNATGLPISAGVSGLGAGVADFLATPSSANLATAVTGETGSGALVFAASPALSDTPTAPTAANGTNTTQIATTAFVLANSVSLAAANTFTNTTQSTSKDTGSNIFEGGIGVEKNVALGGTIITTQAPTTAAQMDNSGVTGIVVADTANAAILPTAPNGGFFVGVVETVTHGHTALYLCASGAQPVLVSTTNAAVWVAGTTTPGAGENSLGWSGTEFKVYNNIGASCTYKPFAIKLS